MLFQLKKIFIYYLKNVSKVKNINYFSGNELRFIQLMSVAILFFKINCH